MRITKRGEINHGYEGQWNCPRCHCSWEMDETDPKPAQSSDQRDGDAYHRPCPTCNHDVWRQVNKGYNGPG